MGRHKIPESIKELQGTLRQHRANHDAPEYPLEMNQEPPEHFSKLEQMAWNEIVPQLIRSKVYTTIDQTAVVQLCVSLARMWSIQSVVRDKLYTVVGGQVKANNDAYKLIQLEQMAWKSAYNLMLQFGLTPVARMNLKVQPADGFSNVKVEKVLPTKPEIMETIEPAKAKPADVKKRTYKRKPKP